MSFEFKCPHCKIELESQDDWVGMETTCPGCRQSITITKEPAKEEPVKDTPIKDEPVKEVSVKEAPVNDAPIKDEPVKDAPVKEEPQIKFIQASPMVEPHVEESGISSVDAESPASENNPLKSRTVYLLLGILLSCSGAHDFYAGYTTKGIIKLSITLCSCCTLAIVSTIWSIVDVCTVSKDAEGRPFAE